MTKVSIIVTAYQKASIIARTLESALNQTYDDFELIVVDDGSRDNTREIVAKFEEVDARVRYIYQENQGPSGARNTGIVESQGDLIALLDGDDAWDTHKIQYQVEVMDAYQAIDLLFTNSRYIDERDENDSNSKDYYHDYVLETFAIDKIPDRDDLSLIVDKKFADKLLGKNIIHLSSVIFRRTVFEATGVFDPNLRGPEDIDYWVRAILAGQKFAYSHIRLATYYKNSTSLVQENEITIQRQLHYAYYAYTAKIYAKVKKSAKMRLERAQIHATLFFLHRNQPSQAWKVFVSGLPYNVNYKAFLLLMTSFVGIDALSIYKVIKRHMRKLRSSCETLEP